LALKKKIYYYTFFCLLYLLSILLTVSLISFFHFYLGHSLEVIEEWVFDGGWGIIIFGKLFSLFWVFKFYNLKRGFKYSFKDLVWNNFSAANRETLLILLFFLGLTTLFGLKLNESFVFDSYKLIISYFLGLLFYLIDIFFIALLGKDYANEEMGTGIGNLIFSLMFAFTSKISFLLVTINSSSGKPNLVVPFFNMLILLFLSNFNKQKKINLTNPFLFLVFFICPMMSMLGWDPIWGATYSPFEGGVLFDSKTYFAVCLFILYYLYLKDLKFFKNILKKEK
jgi:hypothetical protein